MIAGTISIELAANVARIQQDMERARRVVDDATTRMGNAAGMAKSALGAIAGVLSVAAFAGWIKGAIDAADAAGKMSAKTGIAVQDLGGLQLAFDLGGAGADNIVSAMAKLNKAAGENSVALKALGVNTKAAGTDGKAMLYSVADAFAKMEDGAKKTAIAIEIFGKSGADMIPLLNDGSEGMRKMDEMARKLGMSISEEAADAAGAFNDNLDLLMLGSTGVAQQIAGEMLPTLSSLSGSFLESMTSGDKLARTAQFIGTVLKLLYTVAVGTVEIFSTVGKVIGGIAALIQGQFTGAIDVLMKVAKGDLTGAWNTAKQTVVTMGSTVLNVATDVGDGWASTGKQISDAWSGAGDKAFEEAAKMRAAAALTLDERKKAEAAAEAAAKKSKAASDAASKARQTYLAGITKEVDELGLSTTAIKLREGAALGLGVAELKLVAAMLAKRDAFAAQKKLDEESKKVMEKAIADSDTIIDAINDETKALIAKVKAFGMLPEAITRVQIAELEASKSAKVWSEEGLAILQRRIDALGKLADAQGGSARQDENKKAADDNLNAQVSMWKSVEETAHDTWISIFDSGKSALDRLRDTLKNGLLDMLYQMTIKQWIFDISASAKGGGTPGISQGAAGSGGPGIFDTAKNLYGAFSGTLAKSIGTSISAAGKTFGSSALSSFGSGMSGGAGTGLAGSAGSAVAASIPFIATAVASFYVGKTIAGGYEIKGVGKLLNAFGALGGAANRLFGRKAKEYGDTTLNGAFGASGFAGTTDTAFLQKGGLFRSDKRGADKVGIDAVTAAKFADEYEAIKVASTDFAKVLGLNADALQNRSQSMSIKLGKDQVENEAAVAKFFTNVADTIASELLPSLSAFATKGEAASTTLERVAGNYAFVDVALDAIGKTFGAVGLESIAARERLVALSGDNEALGKGTAFFAQNFLTEGERLAPIAVKLKASLADMGLAFVDTRDEFKSIVLGLDLTTASGAETYAGLMRVQEAFAQIYPAAEAASDAIGERAKAAQDAMRTSLGELISKMRSFGEAARALGDGLKLSELSTLTPEQQYAEARRQYETTKAAAYGGDERAQGNFSAIANAFLSASQRINGGDSMYSADFAGVIKTADEIAKWSDGQIDVAQASLNAQEAQLAALTQLNTTMTSIFAGGPGALVGTVERAGDTALAKELQAVRAELAGFRADAAKQTGDSIISNVRAQADAADAIVTGVTAGVRPQITAKNTGAVLDN